MESILTNKWSLVTGASSGLGVEFARQLAKRGSNVVLVARRESLLQNLREELVKLNGVTVHTIAMDLSTREAPDRLYSEVSQLGILVDVLINNAGFGLYGRFAEIPWQREENMLDLDIFTLTHLTKLFVKDMIARGSGHILQVASIGAFQPTPLYASYSAAKSYVLNFSEALHYELRDTGVQCTALSPGITATEFLQHAGQTATPYQRMMMMKSADVARIGIDALLRGKSSVVPGFLNAMTAWSTRLMPRRLQAAVAYRLMKASTNH